MPFLSWKARLAESLCQNWNLTQISPEDLIKDFSLPPKPELGHLALPCFKMAKWLSQSPVKIAMETAQMSFPTGVTATPTGPYVNFRISPTLLGSETLQDIFSKNERYGMETSPINQKIILEYCSPNIAKRLGFQHIRSTLIGNVLANVYRHLGFDVTRINFIGDWGTQFARLVAAFELWGQEELLNPEALSKAMGHLLSIYVKFHQELDQNPELTKKASACLQRLEEGEPALLALWKKIRDISILSMNHTLKRMNVAFDCVEGESSYIKDIERVLEQVKTKTSARISEGAWIVELPGISTPALIQKKDGTTLYLTRDIAGALDRHERFKFTKHFYVVSEQQKLHFQQLFGILNQMGCDWAKNCEHISFGTVLFGSEKMSTREGRVILLDQLLDEAKERALAECVAKNPELENKEQVAEAVGVGAVIFGELSIHRHRDVEFDWEALLSFEGETGPYVQYSAVRCRSLLDKAQEKGIGLEELSDLDDLVISPEEEQLILFLASFRACLHQVIQDNEPFHLTHYLIDLAKAFNRFYYKHPVLQSSDDRTRTFRLLLVKATLSVLENGLSLLGITCPQKM